MLMRITPGVNVEYVGFVSSFFWSLTGAGRSVDSFWTGSVGSNGLLGANGAASRSTHSL